MCRSLRARVRPDAANVILQAGGPTSGFPESRWFAPRESATGSTGWGVARICLGLSGTLCYLFFGRYALSLVFPWLTAVGALAVHRSRRSDGASLLLFAQGVLAIFLPSH